MTNLAENFLQYTRNYTPSVKVGSITIGADAPIIMQSMTNTDTNSIEESITQCKAIFDAGASMVRLTAQGVREAEALKFIQEGLVRQGYNQPLVADIHFSPQAALVAAQHVQKVRINPGNYVTLGSLNKTDYTEEEYNLELQKISDNLRPLLQKCKEYGTAIRIGVNHGSLSQRIVSKYGDTPMGMVMSMIEFLRICKQEDFSNIICSIKASNTRVMVYATRLLTKIMREEDLVFPIHLGVTEAGEGEDGRIKSAVGIGTLLLEGIGDTIRVSLTEAPEKEIPVCDTIIKYRDSVFALQAPPVLQKDMRKSPYAYSKNLSVPYSSIGGENVPIVVGNSSSTQADWVFWHNNSLLEKSSTLEIPIKSIYTQNANEESALEISTDEISLLTAETLVGVRVIIFTFSGQRLQHHVHKLYEQLSLLSVQIPVLFRLQYSIASAEEYKILLAMELGSVYIDGFGDGLWLENSNLSDAENVLIALSILQATRSRFSKTEFIACPSCGRTLFNIEKALADVKEYTSHLKGLKIAVMGCVVNGPGEMVDADYGYVGAGRGTVNLYKKQDLIRKGVPEKDAVFELIALIKDSGDWKDPEAESLGM